MRFYVSPEFIFPEKNIIELKDPAEVRHICNVMRLGEGDPITVFDGQGREYLGEIKEIKKQLILITIRKSLSAAKGKDFSVTLYQAIPKKSKMDFIVEKAVELGVDKIVPVATERTIPELRDKVQGKTNRWQRIAKAASKQCGRARLPLISTVMDFNSALDEARNNELVILAALDNDAKPLNSILKGISPKSVALFIGPEGDFSNKEILLAKKNDINICSLGTLVLRVETAAIYALSALNYELA